MLSRPPQKRSSIDDFQLTQLQDQSPELIHNEGLGTTA